MLELIKKALIALLRFTGSSASMIDSLATQNIYL